MKVAGVILAAGKGKRMGTDIPKVLIPVCGIPMIVYPAYNLKKLRIPVFVVVGHKREEVQKTIEGKGVKFLIQKEQKGTADAVRCALKELKGFTHLLVLYGDNPLLRASTIKRLLKKAEEGYDCVFLTGEIDSPDGYGRVIRKNGYPVAVKEDAHLTGDERKIKEVNMGTYIFRKAALEEAIRLVRKNPHSGEFYLTDVIEILHRWGLKLSTISPDEPFEGIGVNTPSDLLRVTELAYREGNRKAKENGSLLLRDDLIFISPLSEIKRATIHPGVRIDGICRIEEGTKIEEGCIIMDSIVKKGAQIKPYSILEKAVVGENVSVGPFARLREGTVLKRGSRIGNFVEVKKSIIGEGVKAQHLSYIGDAWVGKETNIGAGTITCNFDGFKKNRTYIGKNVFVGSDVQFVAPVRIGDGAWIGAGSTITKDVPPYALGISRAEQRNIKDYAKRKKRCAE